MKITIIGYGKMGKEVEAIATERGHEIVARISSSNSIDLNEEILKRSDIAIEFTKPSSAVANIELCLENGTPVITGTTGWLNDLDTVAAKCDKLNGALLYASNFSIGVNILFEMNRQLARIMDHQTSYKASLEETHHIHKKDEPSGTAITLAEDMIKGIRRLNGWQLTGDVQTPEGLIPIQSFRRGEIIGTHSVTYENEIDIIQLSHFAKNRKGFALGAVMAAEWLSDKTGIYTMSDMMRDLTS
jgi:4-hydroxy-tetrahydrodipicolinate reductase